ncbi:nucleotidyl transferase AbiEii/AbiGii toxin family protein [Slackia piriformis]
MKEADNYPRIRMYLKAMYPPMAILLKIDVTTRSNIAPGPIAYDYSLLFNEGSLGLTSYPLETVPAEKPETAASRGVTNTRPRGFCDIRPLWRTRGQQLRHLHVVGSTRTYMHQTRERGGDDAVAGSPRRGSNR